MKHPTKRTIHFHGEFKNKFQAEPLDLYADSVHNLINILYKCVYPDLIKEKHIDIVFESTDGTMTQLIDPEQHLSEDQVAVHIMPNPDGALAEVVYAVVAVIIAIGVSLLLAPKMNIDQETASGANWENPENVVGQGGIIPVILGETLAGSRIASYGIDATVFRSKV
jgi:predicted phage tail protein